MAYSITYKKSVSRDLAKLSKSEARRIIEKLDRELPRKADTCPVLKGRFAGLRKYCVGDYRIVFAILKDEVLVLRISHRKDIYRKGI